MADGKRYRIDEIRALFWKEFSSLADRFRFMCLTLKQARDSSFEEPARPGVYVFWNGGEVVKVGRSFTNARKRALEHVQDNTGGGMQALGESADARLLLFLVDDDEDIHWPAALEVFLEQRLNPRISSKRLG